MHVWHTLVPDAKDRRAAPSALAGDPIHNRTIMDHAYLGPGCERSAIGALLERNAAELKAKGCCVEMIKDQAALCRSVAEDIEKGLVVGWFQGRMEWGPRALGNRSTGANPGA